jgi:hypothetical protein
MRAGRKVERAMVRSFLAVGLAAALCGPPAHGQGGEGDEGRYQFNRVDGGYVRLDLKSGQVSMCGPRETGWTCLPVADDRTMLDGEIARLQRDNAALKKALLDRGLPLPDSVAAAAAHGADTAAALPAAARDSRVMSAVARVWRRLVELMVGLRKS